MNKTLLTFLFSLIFFIGQSQTKFVKFNGTGDGSSWENASGDLKFVLDNASAGAEIWVAEGTYYPNSCSNCTPAQRGVYFQINNGVEVFGGFAGNETTRNQRDWNVHPTILSGNINDDDDDTNNAFTVVYFLWVSPSTILDGFIIEKGYSKDSTHGLSNKENAGGGIFNYGAGSGKSSNPTIKNCTVRNNYAEGFGGGFFNNGAYFGTANPYIENCFFIDNSSNGNSGGVMNDASLYGHANPEYYRCSFSRNHTNGSGGGLMNYAIKGESNPKFTNCRIENNTAENYGGAMYNQGKEGEASPILINCLIAENEADAGAGIYNLGSKEGVSSPEVINCLFYKNTAEQQCGAFYCNSGNIPDTGTVEATLTNCIFLENQAPNFRNFKIVNAHPFIGYSSVDVANANALNETQHGGELTIGAGMLYNQNPEFADANNGNFHLSDGSPAIDIGDNAVIAAFNVVVDFDDIDRLIGGSVDLGIFERTSGAPSSEIALDCSNDISVTLQSGETGTHITWNEPVATTTCPNGDVTVTQVIGLANGSFFPIGVHTIRYTANDECGSSESCTFTVTIHEGQTGELSSVGDFIWSDNNDNGIQDAGEQGIAGVWITLFNCDDEYIAGTQSDANGRYSFDGINPGVYRIKFAGMLDYSLSPSKQGSDDTVDSDMVGWSGYTNCFTLVGGEHRTSIDAGFVPDNPPSTEISMDCPGHITVTAESGASGTNVSWDLPTAVSTCPANGATVSQTSGLPSGSFFTIGTHSITYSASDNCGNTASCGFTVTVEFQDASTATIGDFAWNDLDGDGVQDGNEPGLAGVTVQLTDCGQSFHETTITNANGFYIFENIAPGAYEMSFAYANDDFSPTTSVTIDCFTVNAGDNITDKDVGYYEPPSGELASVGDFVWSDNNGNGIQDAGEAGIGGLWVSLYACSGDFIAATQCNASGYYSFSDLDPGSYRIKFAGMLDHTLSPSNQGGDDTVDSDMVGWSGYTECFTLIAGQNNTLIDAGFVPDNPPVPEEITIDCPDNISLTLQNGATETPVIWNTPTATTTCATGGLFVTQTAGEGSGTSFTTGVYVIAYVATDDCGNAANCSFTVTIIEEPAGGQIGIGNFVWGDDNGNGIQDAGEVGLEGVWLMLTDCNSNFINSTTTGADGSFFFENIASGSYKIKFAGKSGYHPTIMDAGNDDTVDSDMDENWSGYTDCFNYIAGTSKMDIDAGFAPYGNNRFSAEITTFEIAKVKQAVRLNWMNNTGYKLDRFEVEKSSDGITFQTIIEREGLSEDNTAKVYNDIDENPIQGINYYRLKQVNLDGSIEYSDVRQVAFDYDLKAISLYPNPTLGDVYLNLKAYAGLKGRVSVFNTLGLTQKVVNLEEISETAVRFDLSDYRDGVYFFRVEVDGYRQQTLRVIYSEF